MPQIIAEDDVDGLHRNCSDDQLYREPGDHLRYEQYRLETFNNWPQRAAVDKHDLATNGFYYLGEGDRVKCAFCNIILSKWERGDVVSTEHRKYAPRCPLLTENSETVGNIPHRHVVNSNNRQMTAKHLEYRNRETRLKSFTSWPSDLKQRPDELSCAGFFFLGSGDAVKCFYCGGIIRSWEEADIPWEEHKRWFPSCPFIIENSLACQEELQKRSQTKSICVIAKENGYSEDLLNFHKNYGEENRLPYPVNYEDLVDELEQLRLGQESVSSPGGATGYTSDRATRQRQSPVSTVTSERNSPKQPQRTKENKPTQQTRPNAIKTQWSVDERFQCKICFENHVEVIFLPCKHVCCCQKCYNKLRVQECPICRAKIKGVQPLYFA